MRKAKTWRTTLLVGVFAIAVAVILLPNLIPLPHRAVNGCVSNLRMLQGAKETWALESRRARGDAVAWGDIKPYLKMPLVCSRGGTYIIGRVGELPRCSTGGDHALPPEKEP